MPIVLLLVWAFLFGSAQVPGNPEQPSVEQEREGDTFRVYVLNPLFAPITIRFMVSSSNMQLSEGADFEQVIPARSRALSFEAAPDSPQAAWTFDYRQRWVLGDITAQHNEATIYDLPFASGKTYTVMQGYGGKFSHSAELRYSIDFEMLQGTPVLAAREGTVVRVETSYTQGGVNPALRDKANLITILHSDGTLADYVHLRPGGSLVGVGQSIKRGQTIGYSGNTGYTSKPHLHFHVYKAVSTAGAWQTLPTRFRTRQGQGISLQEGRSYTRP